MATLSVKSIAASCLDVSAPLSIRSDVFGYIWGPVARPLSLKQHLQLIREDAFNLSIFLVGHEPGFGGQFTEQETLDLQFAIAVMRELYSQVSVGVRKLYWRYIPTAEANGFNTVDASEATELTEAFSGPNDGIDLFIVTSVSDAAGWSNRDGPCDKDEKGERTGAVVETRTDTFFWGVLLAHEVGHYLGLAHAGDITNVMGDDSDGDGIGSIDTTSVNLTQSQGDTMKSHCSIRPDC